MAVAPSTATPAMQEQLPPTAPPQANVQTAPLNTEDILLPFEFGDPELTQQIASNETIYMITFTLDQHRGQKTWQQMHAYVQTEREKLKGLDQAYLHAFNSIAALSMIDGYLVHENTEDSKAAALDYITQYYNANGTSALLAAIALQHVSTSADAALQTSGKVLALQFYNRSTKDYLAVNSKLTTNPSTQEQLYLDQQIQGLEALKALL